MTLTKFFIQCFASPSFVLGVKVLSTPNPNKISILKLFGLGTNFWANSLFVLLKNEIIIEFEFATPTIIKLIPILFSTLGAYLWKVRH